MAKRRIAVVPGQKYGKLTVIEEAPSNKWGKHKKRMVRCRCDCGQETVTRLEYLRNGHTNSCGCMRKDISAKVRATHNKSGTRLHRIWSGMLSRCRNKNNVSYKNYGALGISVCDEWLDFATFYRWAKTNGYEYDLRDNYQAADD